MNNSKNNFTNAIKEYFCRPDNIVNIVSNEQNLATRHVNLLVVGDANVNRSELNDVLLEIIDLVEDFAASFIEIENVHPLKAVDKAYHIVTTKYIVPLSMTKKYPSELIDKEY